MPGLTKQLFKNNRLKHIRHRIEFWGMRGLADLIPCLSRRNSLKLATAIGWAAHKVDRRGRRLAERNLNSARQTGQLEIHDSDIQPIIRDCYQNFARNFIDLFWHARINAENLAEWVDFEGAEALDLIRDNPRGGILLTPHFGSFEWSSLIVGLLGIKLNIVIRDFRNPLVKAVFTDARQANGHQVCDHERVALRLIRSLHRGTSVAMLSDLAVPPQRAATSVNMFGKQTTLTTLPAELAIRCSSPIVAAICEPLPHGRAKLKIVKVVDPRLDDTSSPELAKHYTQTIWDAFEAEIKRSPTCWLWMYKHWRFSNHAVIAPVAEATEPAIKNRTKAA
ncbi:lysophospholipid acyltransferase family protein [Planctomycetaceae bacterium SH139]